MKHDCFRNVLSAAARCGAVLCLAGLAAAQPLNDPAAFWNEATLYRDEYGTPHIHAASVRGMAFAFGYAQAEDHLEPMLMAYRVATGRAAEVGGEPFAESDAFAVKIANGDTAAAAMAVADPLTRDLCEGFALGINAWILEHQDRAPAWADGVQPRDVLAWWHYLMMVSAPFDLSGVYHPEPPLQRANAWALAPANTIEGATLLVLNPHQNYDGPYRWYEAHLMIGDVNWAGATLYGVPVLMMGHNEYLGWGLTPNQADTADFFREEIGAPAQRPNDPRLPLAINDVAPLLSFMANARPYYVRTSNGLVERAVPSLIGGRGPVFEGTDGALYSWCNGAFQQFGGLRQLLFMGQATNLAQFQDALALQQFPGFQILYADKEGNLFYTYNARTGNKDAATGPNEPEPLDWNRPVEAIRHMWAWSEIIPPAQLPQIKNPDSGFLQACGTPPWLATANSGLSPDAWPAWLVPEQPNYRVFRVNQILAAGKYSFADMQAMLFDTLVPAAADMVPLLLAMADARPELINTAHPDLVTALHLLREWDLRADTNSAAMAYYNIWWTLMVKRHAAEFQNEAGLYQGLLANSYAGQAYALDAAAEAARIMRNDFNNLSTPWGSLHRLHRGNRNEAMFGTSTGDPIFVSNNQVFQNRQWHANAGYGFAMAVQFGERTRAASIVPFGASENPNSFHFQDQMDLFLGRRMKRTRFQYDAVVRHAASGYGRHVALGTPSLDGTCAITVALPREIKLEEIADPPRPYPGGQVPFTPAIRPLFEGLAPEHSWNLELYVPDEVCRPEHLDRLHIYTYSQEAGWVPLVGQRFDPARGAFTGAGSGPVMLAILGPRDLHIDTEAGPATEILAEAAPSDAFLRAPIMIAPSPPATSADPNAPGQPGDPAITGAPMDPAMTEIPPGEVTAAAPETRPKRPLVDIEYMDEQNAQPALPDGTLPPDGVTAPPREEKRGFFAPLRKLKRNAAKKNFEG